MNKGFFYWCGVCMNVVQAKRSSLSIACVRDGPGKEELS